MTEFKNPRLATVRDFAGEAALSRATVSRWLNGSIKLPEVTAERIRRAVVLLRYEPNLHARRSSLRSTDTLALVVPDLLIRSSPCWRVPLRLLQNPWGSDSCYVPLSIVRRGKLTILAGFNAITLTGFWLPPIILTMEHF